MDAEGLTPDVRRGKSRVTASWRLVKDAEPRSEMIDVAWLDEFGTIPASVFADLRAYPRQKGMQDARRIALRQLLTSAAPVKPLKSLGQ